MMKIKTRLQLVLLRVMAVLLPQKAVVRMETPAAAIMATTAGRRVARTLWKTDNLLVGQMLEGMQSGVGAVIAIVVYEMAGGILHEHNCLSNVIMFAAFTASCIFQVNVIYIILICGALGILKISYQRRRTSAS